jgi:hypothetical protein
MKKEKYPPLGLEHKQISENNMTTKPKPVNWDLIESEELYDIVGALIQKYHSQNLSNINYVLMWRHSIKTDQDGFTLVSSISKSSDQVRELRPHDVVIGINKSVWDRLKDNEKDAIIDYQLERIALCLDKEGNPKEDDKSRLIYRLRRSEVVDDATIKRRHGTTIQEIQEIAASV